MKLASKTGTLAAAALLSASALGLAAAPQASAIPTSAQSCSGDACMYLSTPSNGTVYIQAWAYNQNFYGYWHVSGPSLSVWSNGNYTWLSGKRNYFQVSNISAIVGTYCVTGYNSNGSQVGNVCNRVE